MTSLPACGAFAFGLVIGWLLYFLNRYRRTDANFSDITTILGAIGGAAVTALFGEGKGALFGAYGVGLAVGFFAYFAVLAVMVFLSDNFGVDYFLDGRRRGVKPDETIPGETKAPSYMFDVPPDTPTAITHAAVTAAIESAKKG